MLCVRRCQPALGYGGIGKIVFHIERQHRKDVFQGVQMMNCPKTEMPTTNKASMAAMMLRFIRFSPF